MGLSFRYEAARLWKENASVNDDVLALKLNWFNFCACDGITFQTIAQLWIKVGTYKLDKTFYLIETLSLTRELDVQFNECWIAFWVVRPRFEPLTVGSSRALKE